MSGYADNGAFDPGTLGPGTRFIAKPFTQDALLVTIREAMARRDLKG
jgi:hypothetical protein